MPRQRNSSGQRIRVEGARMNAAECCCDSLPVDCTELEAWWSDAARTAIASDMSLTLPFQPTLQDEADCLISYIESTVLKWDSSEAAFTNDWTSNAITCNGNDYTVFAAIDPTCNISSGVVWSAILRSQINSSTGTTILFAQWAFYLTPFPSPNFFPVSMYQDLVDSVAVAAQIPPSSSITASGSAKMQIS